MATEYDNVIRSLCEKEVQSGCYDCTVGGVPVYGFIRFKIRNFYLKAKGFDYVENNRIGVNYWSIVKSFFYSFIQLAIIVAFKKKYEVLFYPFLRLDNVNGYYLDKFTDPIIDCCDLKENYVIFERCRLGEHPRPRLHNSRIVYTNCIDLWIELYARLMTKRLSIKHKSELDVLFETIEKTVGNIDCHRNYIENRIFASICALRIYEWLLTKLGIRKIFAPSRVNFLELTYVAKKKGIVVHELQHGISYGETALYSGYKAPGVTPDYFLAFGDTQPRDVYGIDEGKIITVGWAFRDYLRKLSSNQEVCKNKVLVISNPNTSDNVLRATFQLADSFKNLQFVVRPHPIEIITEEKKKMVEKYDNVSFQDSHLNLALSMQPFEYVIGVSSTVLYEALNDGKKVAQFGFEGMAPKFMNPEDEDCFWIVNDVNSFRDFIEGKVEDKKSMKIYSKFNKELFMKLYNA